MNDVQVATPEATEIPSGASVENPEVTQPESREGTPSKTPEQILKEEFERKERAMQKRIDRLTREKYQSRAQSQEPAQHEQAHEEPRYTEQDVRREAERQVRVREVTERANAIADEGLKSFKDFGEKMAVVLSELPLFQNDGLPTPAMEAIADTDKPAAVLHYLGENPDIAAEIADLSPARQALRIARIETQLASKPAPTASVSKAPAPITPGKPTSTATRDPGQMSDDEWQRWKDEQKRLARQR